MTGSRNWADLSGPALDAALTEESILVLPIGAIEHHGPHLPLNTDLMMAQLLAERIVPAAAASGIDAWLLPPIAYGKSDEHAWAPGTMWVSAFTLLATLSDLGRSITTTRARTIVFYNGHGGNLALLQVALRELRTKFGLRTFLMNVSIPAGDGDLTPGSGPDERGFGIHGGHGETSLAMHLRPELVDLSLATRAVPDHLADFTQIGFGGAPIQFGWTSDDFGSGGVIGDPTGSTAEWGATLAENLVADGVSGLAEIARFRAAP